MGVQASFHLPHLSLELRRDALNADIEPGIVWYLLALIWSCYLIYPSSDLFLLVFDSFSNKIFGSGTAFLPRCGYRDGIRERLLGFS